MLKSYRILAKFLKMIRRRRYKLGLLPYAENVKGFAPPYFPEKFSKEEKSFLKPFFSNCDKPVFVVQHLPEEVIGALSSRYSRSTLSLRRMFLDEYIAPVAYPQRADNWSLLTTREKKESLLCKRKFYQLIKFLNSHGGVDYVVNVQRGRAFFDRWLAEYGDDSIAEMGGIHLCIEGLSNVATKEVEDKRVGISPLEKSTRYVSFSDKRADGQFGYVVPGEISGTKTEGEYRDAMDSLFKTYSDISGPYFDYIKTLYPRGVDETDRSYEKSRAAKRFDDIRDLLPFSTQTNVALFGNGRAFEDIVNRLMYHPLGELRYWGQEVCSELEKIVPSFVRRPKTERGGEAQVYRTNLKILRDEMSEEMFAKTHGEERKRWVRLLSYPKDADVAVLSTFLFSANDSLSLSEIRKKVAGMSESKRKKLLARILEERKFANKDARREEVRFRKAPRAFENAHFLFEVWARGGDYRDLHRHRQLTQERQRFSTAWGYDLEKEVLRSPFKGRVIAALEKIERIYSKLAKVSPDVAQYAIAFGFIQHWYINLTAREIYWISELRTSPQGRPHYRMICQEMARQAIKVSPGVFQGLMVDWNDYSLSRRESEKKIETKLKKFS